MLEGSELTLETMFTMPKMSVCSLFYINKKVYVIFPWRKRSLFLGFVAVDVRFPGTNYIFVVDPVYWVPNNTTNTISPGAINLFSSFKNTLVEPLKKIGFIFYSSKKLSYANTIKNLDCLKIKV